MKRVKFYVGLEEFFKERPQASGESARALILSTALAHYPKGATVQNGFGGWLNPVTKHTEFESVLVIEVLTDGYNNAHEGLARALRTLSEQHTILVTIESVDEVLFIEKDGEIRT